MGNILRKSIQVGGRAFNTGNRPYGQTGQRRSILHLWRYRSAGNGSGREGTKRRG